MMLRKKDAARDDTRSKSNFLRRRRVARAKDLVERRAPNGTAQPRRRRV